MLLIGLTGGIASGKSVVARRLADHGAVHVDADALAREAVDRGTEALTEIEREFGADVVTAEGDLDRRALAAIVFGDRAKLDRLNAITHPAVRALARERISAAGEADPDAVVVYDIPLLVETGRTGEFDLVVVVEASDEVRIERLVDLRGMSRTDAESRIASQATNAERRAVADIVIDSGSTLEETLAAADEVWRVAARSAAGKH
ncbi:dephospho-CoA kinase [Marisediminicola sp. LYQ134]|uniref:dephospho-CoA kinase n=1 Tax=Marisediminicola sp. LYQ134 TaxID=3391061 RepID=UPI003983D6AF